MENVQLRLLDRISILPDSLMEAILMPLPIRDAVRSSILSRKWRHVWTKLPKIVLDETLWENVATEKESAQATFKKVVYQLLSCHDEPIKSFTLSYHELGSCTEIDDLIFFVAKSHLEDFTLEMWKDCYLLPDSILLCPKLRHLCLRLCSIKSFASVKSTMLTSLKLFDVSISAETLARLISGSPLLEILEIENEYDEIDICIDAPNLRTLDVTGLIKSIDFRWAPILGWMSIFSNPQSGDIVDFGGVGRNIAKFFDCLVSLETLKLSYHVVKSFGGEIPKRLATSLIQLKFISIYYILFSDKAGLLFTLCLLRSAPNVKSIEIVFDDHPDADSLEATAYMKGEDFSDMCLSELEEVTLHYVTGTKPELEFIKLLLAKSSGLKKIEIHLEEVSGVYNGLEIANQITKFERISKEVKILLKSY